jgi:hypothetical protein
MLNKQCDSKEVHDAHEWEPRFRAKRWCKGRRVAERRQGATSPKHRRPRANPEEE